MRRKKEVRPSDLMYDIMDLQEYGKKFKLVPKANKNKELAKEIWEAFGKRLSFPVIMKLIKTKGYNFVWETFTKLKKEGNLSVPLFVWTCGKEKIRWIEPKPPDT